MVALRYEAGEFTCFSGFIAGRSHSNGIRSWPRRQAFRLMNILKYGSMGYEEVGKDVNDEARLGPVKIVGIVCITLRTYDDWFQRGDTFLLHQTPSDAFNSRGATHIVLTREPSDVIQNLTRVIFSITRIVA